MYLSVQNVLCLHGLLDDVVFTLLSPRQQPVGGGWKPAAPSGTKLQSANKNNIKLLVDCSSQLASKMPLVSDDFHRRGPSFQGPMALLGINADLMCSASPLFSRLLAIFFFHLVPTNPTGFLLPDAFDAAQLPFW